MDATGAASSEGSARIDALDALRGLAVLGIFVINIIGFGLPEIAFSNPKAAGGDGALNYGLWSFTTIFVEGSMRGLFSLMFGAGVILFTARAVGPDGPIRIADLYYRRTFWLILFGLIHAYVFLMPGDILLIYGLAGLFLFPFRSLQPRKLVLAGTAIMAVLVADTLYLELEETRLGEAAAAIEARGAASEREESVLAYWQATVAENWPSTEELEAIIEARTGDPGVLYASNAETVNEYSEIGGLIWWVSDALMLMLLGMALLKWRVITGERSARFYARLAIAGYGIGVGLRAWFVADLWAADFSPILWIGSVLDQPARVAVTLGHIGLFFTAWKVAASSLPMRALTASGRMALTNYISQTIVAMLIFTGVGLGLYGRFDRATLYLLTVAILLAQMAFSLWWLDRYRFGPLEWVWRSLTYWARQPMSRKRTGALAGPA